MAMSKQETPKAIEKRGIVMGELLRDLGVLPEGHLHELSGDLPAAATAYADAARRATDVAERDHLVRQAARAPAAELCRNSRLTERPP